MLVFRVAAVLQVDVLVVRSADERVPIDDLIKEELKTNPSYERCVALHTLAEGADVCSACEQAADQAIRVELQRKADLSRLWHLSAYSNNVKLALAVAKRRRIKAEMMKIVSTDRLAGLGNWAHSWDLYEWWEKRLVHFIRVELNRGVTAQRALELRDMVPWSRERKWSALQDACAQAHDSALLASDSARLTVDETYALYDQMLTDEGSQRAQLNLSKKIEEELQVCGKKPTDVAHLCERAKKTRDQRLIAACDQALRYAIQAEIPQVRRFGALKGLYNMTTDPDLRTAVIRRVLDLPDPD